MEETLEQHDSSTNGSFRDFKRQRREEMGSVVLDRQLSLRPSESGSLDRQDSVATLSPPRMTMSRIDKAPTIQLSECMMKVTSTKGYRTARATHGVAEGCWYFEVTVEYLGETGHCRVGWATKQAHLHAPVGFDGYGFSYRDLEGSKQHQAERHPYGEPFTTGDVIGCLISLPKSQKETNPEVKKETEGNNEQTEHPEKSWIAFFKNTVFQGIAFENIPLGTYFPAVSMFTRPQQQRGVTLELNFNPTINFPREIDNISIHPCPIGDTLNLK